MKYKRKLEVLGYINIIASIFSVTLLYIGVRTGIEMIEGFSLALLFAGLALHGYIFDGDYEDEESVKRNQTNKRREN